jgi:hypothetical protein
VLPRCGSAAAHSFQAVRNVPRTAGSYDLTGLRLELAAEPIYVNGVFSLSHVGAILPVYRLVVDEGVVTELVQQVHGLPGQFACLRQRSAFPVDAGLDRGVVRMVWG